MCTLYILHSYNVNHYLFPGVFPGVYILLGTNLIMIHNLVIINEVQSCLLLVIENSTEFLKVTHLIKSLNHCDPDIIFFMA